MSMDFEIIKNLVLDLSELVIMFNDDLKKGYFENIILESNNIIESYTILVPFLNNIIISDFKYGLNLELIGFIGRILYPAVLFQNSYRFSIIKEMKFFLKKRTSLEELGIFLSNKIISTQNVKKGGFTDLSLQILRFYFQNFEKIMMENELFKILPELKEYNMKYVGLNNTVLQKKFNLTKKYTFFIPIPNFLNFGLNSLILKYNIDIKDSLSQMEGTLFGQLYNVDREKEFLLIFTQNNNQYKNKIIEKICFFENLDLYYKNKNLKKYVCKVDNILNLYYDFKDGIFNDKAFSFEVNFFNKKKFINQIDNLDIFIHLFNTRKLPTDYQMHPLSKYLFLYRNRIVNIYGTVNLFFYIYDFKGKKISHLANLIINLLRNTFSNGYIIQFKSGFFISTYVFRNDFEEKKESFLELFQSLKLEVIIYDNLHFVPFSFYQLPYSAQFNTLTNYWDFPIFNDLQISENMKYQKIILENERKRLKAQNFKNRVKSVLNKWTTEINSLIE